MAANTPLRRYKQNTHGGGIRDPLVLCWLDGITARGELRHQFAHACDLAPTLLDLLRNELIQPPYYRLATDRDVAQAGHCKAWPAGWI
jgi:arylsulfatase A-like enzyme